MKNKIKEILLALAIGLLLFPFAVLSGFGFAVLTKGIMLEHTSEVQRTLPETI